MERPKEKVKNEKYALYFPSEMLQELRDIQTEIGIPVSESIRRMVQEGLDKRKKRP